MTNLNSLECLQGKEMLQEQIVLFLVIAKIPPRFWAGGGKDNNYEFLKKGLEKMLKYVQRTLGGGKRQVVGRQWIKSFPVPAFRWRYNPFRTKSLSSW